MRDVFFLPEPVTGDNFKRVPATAYCNRNRLLAIVGPTGAGKSELALRIAEQLDGEIVNCDSMQIYRGFDIGTAKLRPEERRGIPHHLLDIVDPEEIFSAGDFARQARRAIEEITARGRLPVLTGGTGFYLRALVDGLPDLPSRNEPLRARLARRNPGRLHRLLERLDRAAAERLHPHDQMRVVRALEIRILHGTTAPELRPGAGLPDFAVRKIALVPPREELYRRLNERTAGMFRDGLVEEVRALLARGVPPGAKPFEAVGYRQALAVAEGRMALEDAVTEAQRATRNYAKRQITWFRHEAQVELVEQFGNETQLSFPGI